MVMKQKLVLRQIAGEYILVPTGSVPEGQNGLFVLTEWGAFIWEQIEQGRDTEEILQAVLTEYEVDEATASKDLAVFLDKLRSMNVIE